jgi:hypothetical protein
LRSSMTSGHQLVTFIGSETKRYNRKEPTSERVRKTAEYLPAPNHKPKGIRLNEEPAVSAKRSAFGYSQVDASTYRTKSYSYSRTENRTPSQPWFGTSCRVKKS